MDRTSSFHLLISDNSSRSILHLHHSAIRMKDIKEKGMSSNLKTTTWKWQTSPPPISLWCLSVLWSNLAGKGTKKYHGIYIAMNPTKIQGIYYWGRKGKWKLGITRSLLHSFKYLYLVLDNRMLFFLELTFEFSSSSEENSNVKLIKIKCILHK